MAHLQDSRTYAETPTPKTPKAPHSPTFEQIRQVDASWQYSTSPMLARNHDPEEDFSHHGNRKSVLARVKDKARKLRSSLSAKKSHDIEILDGHTTPPWGVSLEDDNDEEEDDPEYLGAPMYESELAPEACKETARQHPRADPVVPEEHLWPNSIKREDEEENKLTVHNKSITETVSEKLSPAYAMVSDATHAIASKIAGMATSGPDKESSQSAKKSSTTDSRITIKTKSLPSNIPTSTRIEVPPPNSISSTNVYSSSHVPTSRGASLSSNFPVSNSENSSPLIPISTNAQEVVEEQSHGRILQAN